MKLTDVDGFRFYRDKDYPEASFFRLPWLREEVFAGIVVTYETTGKIRIPLKYIGGMMVFDALGIEGGTE